MITDFIQFTETVVTWREQLLGLRERFLENGETIWFYNICSMYSVKCDYKKQKRGYWMTKQLGKWICFQEWFCFIPYWSMKLLWAQSIPSSTGMTDEYNLMLAEKHSAYRL